MPQGKPVQAAVTKMTHLLLAVIYLAFIGLGLPDSLLGSAWPSIYEELGVPVSYAGIISMIIAAGTIVSSLFSGRVTHRFGAGRVTAVSVGMTAAALFGFSMSGSLLSLCLWAVPYGLGAGSVDAALNSFVALHYSSRHMSWLHCMWGIGTIIGPAIMSWVLTNGESWNTGYRRISYIQIILTAVLIISLPLWKRKPSAIIGDGSADIKEGSAPSLANIFRIRGAKEVMLTFFCYCAVEQTTMLWASSYMVLHNGISEEIAAGLASLFFIGITVGRMASGFLTLKFSDTRMVRLGEAILVIGCVTLLMPFGEASSVIGIVLIGLGCAPIYPFTIHSTPQHFGAENSQAIIGVQMASAYIGILLMPPLFGLIVNHISVSLLPVYLIILSALMIVMHELVTRKTKSA